MPSTRSWRPLLLVTSCAALVIAAASRADAQAPSPAGVYVSGGVLADVKRFSGDPTESTLDGEAIGAVVTLGTSIGTEWDLEIGLDLPRSSDRIRERSITLRSSTITLRSTTRNRAVAVTTLVRFRPSRQGRLHLGYVAGISFLHLGQEFETVGADSVPASLLPRPVQSVDYSAAPTVGVDAQIAMGTHLSIVPAIHASAFKTKEVSGILLRPRLSVRWAF